MKIVSRIKPRKRDTRQVSVHGTAYCFAKQADGEFVATVTDPAHIQTFLASRHFHATGQSALQAPAAATPEAKPSQADASVADDPTTAEAQTLIAGSASDIGRAVGNVNGGLAVVRRAIELEREDKNRKTVVSLLEQTLDSAKLAGVTD